MIGAVGNQAMGPQGAEARGAGKRAEAVGQQAKALVAAAREAGAALPKNAQGIAAAAVARGVDPASLFAARVTEPDAALDNSVPPTAEDGGSVTEADVPTLSGEVSASGEPPLALLMDDAAESERVG